MSKTRGSDTGTSGHIERKVQPENADASRTHLNRELVQFPEGVNDRTHAIQYRLKNAGIKRKIAKNQVTVIRINLGGSNEDMKRIEQEGRLNDWANDSLLWLQDTFGKDNIVSAVLHRDETTSHIHAALVPVVTGERRKAMKEKEDKAKTGKRSYRKKSTDTVRLCADDVMTRNKMEDYQTTYAEKVAKYGLQRGVRGSEARHKTTQEYYRELYLQQQTLKEDIEQKEQQKSDIEQQYTQLTQQTDEKTRELEKTQQTLDETKQKLQKEKQAVKTAEIKTKITGTVSSLLGTPKYRQLEQEVESLRQIADEKEKKIDTLTDENRSLKEKMKTLQQEHDKTTDKLRTELKKVYELFPNLRELISIEPFCRSVGFTEKLTKRLLNGEKVGFKGKLYSNEFKQEFSTEHSVAEIEPEPDKPGKLRLTVDGLDIIDWFRFKNREFQKSIGITWTDRRERKGMRI